MSKEIPRRQFLKLGSASLAGVCLDKISFSPVEETEKKPTADEFYNKFQIPALGILSVLTLLRLFNRFISLEQDKKYKENLKIENNE